MVFDEGSRSDLTQRGGKPGKAGSRSWSALVEEAGGAIQEIGGVVSARIRSSREGEVEAVHVVARGTRKPKEIVRDVETLLRARYDLEIDHRKISVARLSEPGEAAERRAPPGRVNFKGVSLRLSREGGEAEVELACEDRHWVGSASARGPDGGWPRLIAQATLDALSQQLPPGSYLELSDLASVTIADQDVVLLSVRYSGGQQSELLLGCASVGGDLQRSVVYATLHALNRFLGRFSQSPQREVILEPPWTP